MYFYLLNPLFLVLSGFRQLFYLIVRWFSEHVWLLGASWLYIWGMPLCLSKWFWLYMTLTYPKKDKPNIEHEILS